jgi:hypothetical protein
VITLKRFKRIEAALRSHGYGETIEWSESIQPPKTAEEFAEEAIYVICNSGMAVTVGAYLAMRCMDALKSGHSATSVYGHPGKAPAIDALWQARQLHFDGYRAARSKLEFLQQLPWIGPVTRHHLAKNLGADEAKPDVHLERLARRDKTTTRTLCRRLARQTGYRVATIDTILWRACADGLLSSRLYEASGWKAAFRPHALDIERKALPAVALDRDTHSDSLAIRGE